MNSRERVRCVLNHQIPDRIPNGLGGCETAGMHVLAYNRLKQYLGVADPVTRMDTFMSNAVFEESVLQAMEGDVILVSSPRMCKAPFRGPDNMKLWKTERIWNSDIMVPKLDQFHTEPDGTVVWETCGNACSPPGSLFFDGPGAIELPLGEVEIPDPKDFHSPSPFTDEILRDLETMCRRLYEETEYSLCLGETIQDLQPQPGGFMNCMILMLEEPEIMQEILDICADDGLKQLEQLDQAVGKYVDILSIAHDFGDNRGVMIGADTWREIYKPSYQKLFGGWKKRTNMKINLHSCGSIADILDDLVECGLEVLNPVQVSARGMDPRVLKETYGDRLVFWGGAYDSQLFPKSKTYDEVYAQVKENLEILGAGGGYILSGVHNMPADMPQEHVAAFMDAWKDCRDYR